MELSISHFILIQFIFIIFFYLILLVWSIIVFSRKRYISKYEKIGQTEAVQVFLKRYGFKSENLGEIRLKLEARADALREKTIKFQKIGLWPTAILFQIGILSFIFPEDSNITGPVTLFGAFAILAGIIILHIILIQIQIPILIIKRLQNMQSRDSK